MVCSLRHYVETRVRRLRSSLNIEGELGSDHFHTLVRKRGLTPTKKMNYYSVLLVDDEEFVFEIMMKKLNWEEMGFQIAGYARNGVEALEMAEEIQPDVVMTDIKMPYMDGLTLCQKLKEQYANIKTIIFSGFDDFEYAKEAIRLEATEYILKPIDSEELRRVFEKMKDILDKEIDERRNIDTLQQYYMNSLPVLQDNFYITLLEGRIQENLIEKYASDYQISLEGPYYITSVLHISYKEKQGKEMEVAPFMLSLSVQKLAEEQLETKWKTKTIAYLGDIVIISQMKEKTEINYYTDFMDRVCKLAKKVCMASVTAGIGHMVEEPAEIRASYREAKNALSHRALFGNERAINIQEIDLSQKKTKNTSHSWQGSLVDDIIKSIKLGEKEDLENNLTQFFDRIRWEEMNFQNYKLYLMKLVVELVEFINQYELSINDVMEDVENFPENVLSNDTKDEVKNIMITICQHLLNLVREKRHDTRLSFVTGAQDYVKEHYADQDLGIESICGHLNVSSSYFSTAFKKVTGKTFINYLTDYRMDEAVRLLKTSEYKTYEIAEKVGYADSNYFSYAFKKKFGISPTKYRRQEK